MTRITHLMTSDKILSNFSTYRIFDAILGHISFSFEI